MSPLRTAAIAQEEFEAYMQEMIRSEKHEVHSSYGGNSYIPGSARGNLLTSVLRASADEAKVAGKRENATAAPTKKQAFTETEVTGNLFLHLLARYETTANEAYLHERFRQVELHIWVHARDPSPFSRATADHEDSHPPNSRQGHHARRI